MFNTNCYGNENIPSYSQAVETPWAAHTTHNSQGIFQQHPVAGNANAFVGYSLGQVQSKELDLAGVVGMKETAGATTTSGPSNAWHSHRMRYQSATTNRGFLPYQMTSLPHYDSQTVDSSHLSHGSHHQPFWMPPANPNAYSLMGTSYQRDHNTAYVDRGDTSRSTAALRHNTAMQNRNYAVEDQSRTVNPSMQQQSAQVLPQHCQRQSRQQIHQLQQHQHQQLHHQQDYLRNQMTQRERDPCQYPTNTYHQESMRVGMDSALYHDQHLIPSAQHQHQQYQASQEALRKASENERRTAFTSRQACFPQTWPKPAYVPYDTTHSQAFLTNHRSSASAFQPCNKQVDSDPYSMDSIWAKSAVPTATSHVPHTPNHSTIPPSNNHLPLTAQTWLHDSTSHLKPNMYHVPQEVKQVTNVPSNFSANVLNLDTGQVELSMSMVPPEFPMYPQAVPQPQRHRTPTSRPEQVAIQPSHRSLPVPSIAVSQSKPQPPAPKLKELPPVRTEQQAKPMATARAAGLDVRQFLATWDEDLDLATPRPACVEVDEPEEQQHSTSLVVLDCQNVPSEEAAGLLHMYPSLQLGGSDMQSVVLLDNGLSSASANGKHNLDFLLSRVIPTSGSIEQTELSHYEKGETASNVQTKDSTSAINVVQSPALGNVPTAQPEVPPTVEKEPQASQSQNTAQCTNAVETQMDVISQPRSQEATTPASLCESDSEKNKKSSLRYFRKRKATSAAESDASESQCSETAEEVVSKSMKHSENDIQYNSLSSWFGNDSMDTIDGPVRTPISVSSAAYDVSSPMQVEEKTGNDDDRNKQSTEAKSALVEEPEKSCITESSILPTKNDLQGQSYKSMPDISENGPDMNAPSDAVSSTPNEPNNSHSTPATNESIKSPNRQLQNTAEVPPSSTGLSPKAPVINESESQATATKYLSRIVGSAPGKIPKILLSRLKDVREKNRRRNGVTRKLPSIRLTRIKQTAAFLSGDKTPEYTCSEKEDSQDGDEDKPSDSTCDSKITAGVILNEGSAHDEHRESAVSRECLSVNSPSSLKNTEENTPPSQNDLNVSSAQCNSISPRVDAPIDLSVCDPSTKTCLEESSHPSYDKSLTAKPEDQGVSLVQVPVTDTAQAGSEKKENLEGTRSETGELKSQDVSLLQVPVADVAQAISERKDDTKAIHSAAGEFENQSVSLLQVPVTDAAQAESLKNGSSAATYSETEVFHSTKEADSMLDAAPAVAPEQISESNEDARQLPNEVQCVENSSSASAAPANKEHSRSEGNQFDRPLNFVDTPEDGATPSEPSDRLDKKSICDHLPQNENSDSISKKSSPTSFHLTDLSGDAPKPSTFSHPAEISSGELRDEKPFPQVAASIQPKSHSGDRNSEGNGSVASMCVSTYFDVTVKSIDNIEQTPVKDTENGETAVMTSVQESSENVKNEIFHSNQTDELEVEPFVSKLSNTTENEPGQYQPTERIARELLECEHAKIAESEPLYGGGVEKMESEHLDEGQIEKMESEHLDDGQVEKMDSEHLDDGQVEKMESEHVVEKQIEKMESEHLDDKQVEKMENELLNSIEDNKKQKDLIAGNGVEEAEGELLDSKPAEILQNACLGSTKVVNDLAETKDKSGDVDIQDVNISVLNGGLSSHLRGTSVLSPEVVVSPSVNVVENQHNFESIFSLDDQQTAENEDQSPELCKQLKNIEDRDAKAESDHIGNERNKTEADTVHEAISPRNSPPTSPREEQSTRCSEKTESSSDDDSSDSSDKSSVSSSDKTSRESGSKAGSGTESGSSSDEDDSETEEETDKAESSDEDSSDDCSDTPTKSPEGAGEDDKKLDLNTESVSQRDEDACINDKRTDEAKHVALSDSEDSSGDDDTDVEESTLSSGTRRSPVGEVRAEEGHGRDEDAVSCSNGEPMSGSPTEENSVSNVNLKTVDSPEKAVSTCDDSVPSDEEMMDQSRVVKDVLNKNEQNIISPETNIADAASSPHQDTNLVLDKVGSDAEGGNGSGSLAAASQLTNFTVHDNVQTIQVKTDLCNGHTSPETCHLSTTESPNRYNADPTESSIADEPNGIHSPKMVNAMYALKSLDKNISSVINPLDAFPKEEAQISSPKAENDLITSHTSEDTCPVPNLIERCPELNFDVPYPNRDSSAEDTSLLNEKTVVPEVPDCVEVLANGSNFVVEEDTLVVYSECGSSFEVAGNVLIGCETEERHRSQEDGVDLSECSSRRSDLSEVVEEDDNSDPEREGDGGKEDLYEDGTDVEDDAEFEEDGSVKPAELNGVDVSADDQEDYEEFAEEAVQEENVVNGDLNGVELMQENVGCEFSEHDNVDCQEEAGEFVQHIADAEKTEMNSIAARTEDGKENGEFVQNCVLQSSERRFLNGADGDPGERNLFARDVMNEEFHAVVYQNGNIDQMAAGVLLHDNAGSAEENYSGNIDYETSNICGTIEGECIEVVELQYDGLCDENMEVFCKHLEGGVVESGVDEGVIQICEGVGNEEEFSCPNLVCSENEVECQVSTDEQLYYCDSETYTMETNASSIEELECKDQVPCEVGREEVCEPWSGLEPGNPLDVVPVPAESVHNWPYVEEILEADATPQWTPEKVRSQMPLEVKCSLSWDRILNEGQGLVLGPANVEVRVPGNSSRRSTHWKVVTRERRRTRAASNTRRSRVEENNNVMPDVKGPIVVVKRLVLKRPRTRRSQRNGKEPDQEDTPKEDYNPWTADSPERPRLSTLKTKGALKAYQTQTDALKASSLRCRARNRSWPSTAKDLNLPKSEVSFKRRRSEAYPPIATDWNGLSPQRLPKVIIKRTGEGPLYQSFICEKDRVVLQPVVCLERNVELDNLALSMGSEGATPAASECGQSPTHSDFQDNRLEDNATDRTSHLGSLCDSERRSRRKPAKVRRVGQLMKVVELLQQWRQAEQDAATKSGDSEPTMQPECDTVENNNSLLCVDNNTDDENHELHLLQPFKYLAAMQDRSVTPVQSWEDNSNAYSRAVSPAGSFTNLPSEEISYEMELPAENATLEEGKELPAQDASAEEEKELHAEDASAEEEKGLPAKNASEEGRELTVEDELVEEGRKSPAEDACAEEGRELPAENASAEEGYSSMQNNTCLSERREFSPTTLEHSDGSESACRSRSASIEDLGSPVTSVCQACGYSALDPEDQSDHIKTHPYHCQRCQLAFLSQEGFKDHLVAEHPSTEEHHHCILCQRTFPTAERHALHRKSWHHCLMERSQRHTIHSLYRLFTGNDCPHLPSLQPEELQALDWLPSDPGVIHFYHDATPLQLAIQDCNLNLTKGTAEGEETSS